MSMTGSLMGYNENNNDQQQQQQQQHHHHHHHQQQQLAKKKALKALPVVASVNAAGVTSASNGSRGARANGKLPAAAQRSRTSSARRRGRRHINNLWSLWYGTIALAFQAYIAARCARRFVAYLSLPWPADAPPPKLELHACLSLMCLGALLLPFLLATACIKVGNLANDGVKLGRQLSTCSREPSASLLSGSPSSGLAKNLWRHGGPTAAFLHLCTAMCFLLPSLLMEARLVHAGFLPKEAVWRTDLDWIVTHRDRLVVLSFMNYPENATAFSLNRTGSSSHLYLEDEMDDYLANSSELTSTLPQPTRLSSSLLLTAEASTDYPSQTTSRKPTSRMNARNVQRSRPKQKKNSTVARSRPSTTTSGYGNWSALSLPLAFDSLADLDHPESLQNSQQMEDEEAGGYGPVSLEFLNYAMALAVYSVRYPAVFWASNKALGSVFSVLMVANAAQSLLAYTGMSVLYKVQVVGPLKVLPLLRNRAAAAVGNLLADRFFLLNPHVTLGIFALYTLLVFCSSMLVYLYAYGRFAAFVNQERERRVILQKNNRDDDLGWTYIIHPAAICLFLAIAICGAPLLYDYTVVYRGSLDGAILACVVGTMAHLALWLLVWLMLAIKKRWVFKIRVTIGRATVRSARSVKLVTDVDLINGRGDGEDGSAAPLLVLGNGRTYTVAETSPKKAIMGVIQKAAMERKARSSSQGDSIDSNGDGDEQIYWLRPKLRASPVQNDGASGQAAGEKGWLNKKLKQKVTFNDLPSTSGSRKGKGRRGIADGGGGPEDDGDYATLRELPLMTAHDDDNISEENKHWGRWLSPRSRDDVPTFSDLLECVNDDQVTYYASGNRDLQPSEGDPTLPDPPTASELPLPLPPPTPTNLQDGAVLAQLRCLRRGDSGMPHDELTPSHSPPLDTIIATCISTSTMIQQQTSCLTGSQNSTSSNSETSSSGVHSNASSQRRANSVEDLTNEPREEPNWRSCSLQRGTQPPGSFASPAKLLSNNPGKVITNPLANYASAANPATYNGETSPAVILENGGPSEDMVVIRRKTSRPKLQEAPGIEEESCFGRSTNMRMTSFTESNDLRAIQASSATLPHYPTQPLVTYPHCSTMPLPHASSHGVTGAGNGINLGGTSGSCGSVLRHPGNMGQPGQTTGVVPTVPSHTTLPSHHNGVRLMLHGGANPFVKRFPPVQVGHVQPWAQVLPTNNGGLIPHHHTFPQLLPGMVNGKLNPTGSQLGRQSDRDSANFSMASSGDSDTH